MYLIPRPARPRLLLGAAVALLAVLAVTLVALLSLPGALGNVGFGVTCEVRPNGTLVQQLYAGQATGYLEVLKVPVPGVGRPRPDVVEAGAHCDWIHAVLLNPGYG